MSQNKIQKILDMPPSAYRSMLMGKYNLTKSNPQKRDDLLRWGQPDSGERWINLTSKFLEPEKPNLACGKKSKKQVELGLPSVCRPSKVVNKKTPKLANTYTDTQILKAILLKMNNTRINWKDL